MSGMKKRGLPVLWWAGAMLAAGALQALPMLMPDSDAGLLLCALLLYAVHPVCAVIVSYRLVRKRFVPPIAACLPFGLFPIILPFYADGVLTGVICILLGIVSAAAADEQNRRERKK